MKEINLRKLLVLTFTLFSCLNVFGQAVRFELNSPPIVESETPFRVEFNLNDNPDSFSPPTFSGVDVIAGPSVSKGQSVSVVGNRMTKSASVTYTYVLMANSVGKITIPAASVVVGGKTYTTRAAVIEVVANTSGSTGAGKSSGKSSGNTGGTSAQALKTPKSIGKDDILLRVITSSTSVYKGEPILVSFKLYTRVPVVNVSIDKAPAFNGFWTQEVTGTAYQKQRETIGGKIYDSKIMKEYLVFPQKSGVLEIEQMSFMTMVQIESQQKQQTLFDNFFGGGSSVEQIRKVVSSQPLKINIKDLPAGAPDIFDGAVGRFTMEASVNPTAISANSSANYDIKISGTGNLPLVNAPKLEMPNSFEKYAVKSSDNFSVSGKNISGSKNFSIPFIPRAEGVYTISGVKFCYFDPQASKYIILTAKDSKVNIAADKNGGASSGLVSGVSGEDLKILESDIRYIRIGKANLHKAGYILLWSWQYIVVILFILILFVLTLIYMQKRIKFRSNATLVRNKRAHKIALKRLKAAQSNMVAGNKKEFYEETLKAMWGYMGDKLNIPVAELSRENISEKMSEKGIDDELIKKYITIISECEYARYAPSGESQIEDIYKATVELFSNIENI